MFAVEICFRREMHLWTMIDCFGSRVYGLSIGLQESGFSVGRTHNQRLQETQSFDLSVYFWFLGLQASGLVSRVRFFGYHASGGEPPDSDSRERMSDSGLTTDGQTRLGGAHQVVEREIDSRTPMVVRFVLRRAPAEQGAHRDGQSPPRL